MSKSTDKTSLGDRCKQYEALTESTIPKEQYIIVRLDGHGFSKYTEGLVKPFDISLETAMVEICKALMTEFIPTFVYTQSDEITMVIPPSYIEDRNNQIYGGRVQKIASLTAGFASAYFNNHFKHKDGKLGYFDARVFGVDSKEEAYNMVMWRCRDAVKNSKNVFAQTYCRHKDLLNMTSQQQVEFCKETTGKDWEEIPEVNKYGYSIFKETYEKEVSKDLYKYLKDKSKTTITRTNISVKAVNLNTFSADLVNLVTNKVAKAKRK